MSCLPVPRAHKYEKSYAVCYLVGLGQLNLRPNLVSINSAPIFLETKPSYYCVSMLG